MLPLPPDDHPPVPELPVGSHEELADQLWQRLHTEIIAYAEVSASDTLPSLVAALRRLDAAVRARRPFTAAELAEFRDYGAIRARLGVPLESVLRGWQIMISEIIERVGRNEIWNEQPGATLMSVVSRLLAASDAATVALSAGHREEQVRADRGRDSMRDDLIRGIIDGSFGVDELRCQAQYLGLRLEGRHAAFRVIGADAVHTEWGLRQQPACRPPHGLTALLGGDAVGFFDTTVGEPQVDAGFVGIGPVAELDGLTRSFRIAGRIAETARLFGLPGRHTLAELGLHTAVVGDTDVGAAFAEKFFGRMDAEEMSPILETVDVYLSAGMNASETANRMFLHHNTVRYRLTRFEELAGVSLKDAGMALQVWWALRYRELGRGRAAPQ